MSSIEIDVLDPPTLARPAPELAPALIGTLLVRLTPELGVSPALVARIVETEAYTEDDAASHSFRGPGGRARVMFGPPGYAYVYLIYGMYSCLNVVCGTDGAGQAVLIRAVEPLLGAEQMCTNRLTSRALARKDDMARTRLAERLGRRPEEIANGPGKVGAAFGVTVQRDYGKSLASSDLLLAERMRIDEPGAVDAPANPGASGDRPDGAQTLPDVLAAYRGEVGTSPRIGISQNTAPHWRFFERDNPAVSKR